MSEDKTTAVEETVSGTPAKETPQSSPNDELIAERLQSKKYRNRAQDAEARYAKLEKSLAKAEEDKLKEKEEFKTLYEKASSELESLSANAKKWAKYEEGKKTSLIQLHPENEHEYLKTLNLETLEFVTSKINNTKPNAPELAGKARNSIPSKPLSEMTNAEKAANWQSILKSYKK